MSLAHNLKPKPATPVWPAKKIVSFFFLCTSGIINPARWLHSSI